MRPSLNDLARYLDLRLRGIEAVIDGGFAPQRITTTGLRLHGQSLVRIPIAGPLPNVSRHIVKTVSIRREGADWRGSFIAVEQEILPGKLTLPSIGHSLAARHHLVAPGKNRAVESTARGVLPLGFGGKLFAYPMRVGFGILVGDVHDSDQWCRPFHSYR